MLKLFEPNKIFKITSKAPKYVLFLFVIVLSIGLMEALFLSPEDYKQSHSVRIMYVHVPSAWLSLGIFSVIAFFSLGIFIFKNKNFSLIAKSLAPIGFIFSIIALATGSIWGKPTWGTWWAWDARITSMLILALFYLMYLLSWKIFQNQDKAIILNTNPDGAKLLAININDLFLKINITKDKIAITEKVPRDIHAEGTWTYIILTE